MHKVKPTNRNVKQSSNCTHGWRDNRDWNSSTLCDSRDMIALHSFVWHYFATRLLLDTLVQPSSLKVLWDTLAWHMCITFSWAMLCYKEPLCQALVGHSSFRSSSTHTCLKDGLTCLIRMVWWINRPSVKSIAAGVPASSKLLHSVPQSGEPAMNS